MGGAPSVTTRACFSATSRKPSARALGDLRITVRAFHRASPHGPFTTHVAAVLCGPRWFCCARKFLRPEAARLPLPSSLPSMAGRLRETLTFPKRRVRLRCTSARKMPPLGGIVLIPCPKPVGWRPLAAKTYSAVDHATSALHAMAILWVHEAKALKCTRVVPTRGWRRSCAWRLTLPYGQRKLQCSPSGRGCPHLWSKSAIYGSALLSGRSRQSTFSTLSSSRLDCSATLSRTEQQFSAVLKQTEEHLAPVWAAWASPSLLVAMGALLCPPELLRPVLNRHQGQRLLYNPALLPFAAPPRICRLCRWSHLHGIWRRGSHCPACLVGDSRFSTRFSSPRDLASSVTFLRLRWQPGMLLSCDRKSLSSWQRMQLMSQGFCSPYFIVPKEGSDLRPILDLRVLNRALRRLPFKMLTHRHMIKCTQLQDRFAALDQKDTYFHISVIPWHRLFLRFACEGWAWQYRVLPSGLSLSPHVFTKVVEGPFDPLREVASGSSTISTIGSIWPSPENNCGITGTWCSGISASWGFRSTGKRTSSPLCRESLFYVWS